MNCMGPVTRYDCRMRFLVWRIQCCLLGTIPVYDSLANVVTRPEDASDLIVYITKNNPIRQSYRVDGCL